MQHFLKNGQYFQRKKLFLQDPFHNMKSHISLDWEAQQSTTQELQRARFKQLQEHQNLKKIYNQQVDQRLQRRFGNFSTIQNDLSKSRDSDILSREVQIFNQSKSIALQSSKNKQEFKEANPQTQPLDLRDTIQSPSKAIGNSLSQSKENYNRFEHSKSMNGNQSYDEYFGPNPQLNLGQGVRQSRSNNYEQQDYTLKSRLNPLTRDRYQSLQVKSPYPSQDLSKLMQQLYDGKKVQQYPFRNMIPDKLQGHLRERTKADKKRSYDVTLNLLKH